jgi:ComF family protein
MDASQTIPEPGPRQRILTLWRTLRRRTVDLVYPPSCLACGLATGEPGALCPGCWRAMPFIERPVCARLGTPLPVDHGGVLISPKAMADPPMFQRARAVARYDGVARDLVQRLKYGDRLDLARPMGRWMARAGAELLGNIDVIVPVPMHPLRLLQRRFNQAAALALVISDVSGKPLVTDALRRVKRTRPQPGLTKTERADNLQGAFKADGPTAARLSGARVLLVDDVMTSGATGNACARALIKAHAVEVDMLVFATVAYPG